MTRWPSAPSSRSFKPRRPWHAARTFFAVVLVVMEDEATAALALITAERVDAVLLAAAVILGALVLVCRGANKGRRWVCAGLRYGRPRGSGGLAGLSPTGTEQQLARAGQARWWGLGGQVTRGSKGALHPAGPAERGPAVGRGGRGSERTSMGHHYLLTGQMDKWKNRHMDKQTARERSRTQGSLFYFTTGNVTDTIKMGGGRARGRVPGPWTGTVGRREHQFCPARGRWAGMAEWRRGVGGHRSPHPIPSKVRFLSNKGSGRPGRPHWGVRFLFCTRNLSWWGRPRGGCRAGLFSETRERRRTGTKGWGWRAGTREGQQ